MRRTYQCKMPSCGWRYSIGEDEPGFLNSLKRWGARRDLDLGEMPDEHVEVVLGHYAEEHTKKMMIRRIDDLAVRLVSAESSRDSYKSRARDAEDRAARAEARVRDMEVLNGAESEING